jgi:hypothetical protein
MKTYGKTNRSFHNICVYRIGNHAGFFSEINNMIMAMIYCMENNIRFKLYSTNTLYCNDLWNDFFEQFIDQVNHSFHQTYNGRDFRGVRKVDFDKPAFETIRQYVDNEFPDQEICLTQDIFSSFRNHKIYNAQYQVKSPYFSGNILLVGHQIVRMIWNYNRKTRSEVYRIRNSIQINTPYAGLHIRRGDKAREARFKPLQDYLKIVDDVTKQENFPVFIATDDQRIIEEIRKINPKRPVYHFNFPENNGFDMDKFSVLTGEQQRNKILQLLAEVDMLVEAQLFVGTFTSNVGMFVGMARNGRESYGVDSNGWLVW